MKNLTSATIIAVAALLCFSVFHAAADQDKKSIMSQNKQTVQAYMDAFTKTDHAAILACLTDDVAWFVPGAFHITGKPEFDKQIENDAFLGSPIIKVSRMIEENNTVVAEGSVRSTRKDGGTLHLLFCDVFEMQAGKIKRLTSYLMEIKEEAAK